MTIQAEAIGALQILPLKHPQGCRGYLAYDPESKEALLLDPHLDHATEASMLVESHELTLRLPHLGLRIREHGRRALELATRLRDAGVAVGYPGLPDAPQHALMKRLMNEAYGFGGILTVAGATAATLYVEAE